MKKNYLKMAFVSLFAVVALGSCDKDENGKDSVPVEVTGITLDKTEITLALNASATLTATVVPDDATDKTVVWTTSDANKVTVNNGTVTDVAEGSATVTATAGSKSATCVVTVVTPVEVTGVTLDTTEITLAVDASATLTATVAPDNATDKTVIWTTSDANKVTVDNGTVTAVAEGSATVTATAGGKSATCTVTAVAPVEVTGVTLNRTEITLAVDVSSTLTATVAPDNATDKTVVWTTSDAATVTVDNGTVTAVAEGSATVTATAGGKSATCTVTVAATVTGLIGNTVTAVLEDGAEYNSVIDYVKAVANLDEEGSYLIASAPYSNGGFTLTLPESVDAQYLSPISEDELPQSVTISNSNAKIMNVTLWASKSNDNVGRIYPVTGTLYSDWRGILIYADADVSLTGSLTYTSSYLSPDGEIIEEESGTQTLDVHLKQGWNIAYSRAVNDSDTEMTSAAPTGIKWYFSADYVNVDDISGSLPDRGNRLIK
jgi:uncharacterized protein YjdB